MKPFEVVLSIKLRATDLEAAHLQGQKLAEAFTAKLGPSQCQCVWAIREDETKEVA